MKSANTLFILSAGRVAAISKKDGSIIWEIKLKDYVGSSIAYSIGQINFENNQLFVGVAGVLVCLNATDGSLIWKNELKGWGYQFVSMTNVSNEAIGAVTQQAASAAAANAAAISAATNAG